MQMRSYRRRSISTRYSFQLTLNPRLEMGAQKYQLHSTLRLIKSVAIQSKVILVMPSSLFYTINRGNKDVG